MKQYSNVGEAIARAHWSYRTAAAFAILALGVVAAIALVVSQPSRLATPSSKEATVNRGVFFDSPAAQRYLDFKEQQLVRMDAKRAVLTAPAVARARERYEEFKLQQTERMDVNSTTSRPAPSVAQQRYQDLKERQVAQAERTSANTTHSADLPPRERYQQSKERQGE